MKDLPLPNKIEKWKIGDVKPYAHNPRDHSEEEVGRLAEFISRVGFLRPIEVDERGVILTGHRRRLAAKKLGLTLVPVIQFKHLDEDEKRAYRIADNRFTLEGEWNAEHLHREATWLKGQDWNLDALGFSNAEIAKALAALPATVAPAETAPEVEDIPDEPQRPCSKLGDVWQLGPHRVMCADALEPANLATLLGKDRGDVVFTDPPYAVYGSSTGIAEDIMDDKMVRPFFRDVVSLCVRSLRPFGHAYLCCDWRSWASWWEVTKGSGLTPKNMLVWDKGGAGLGSNYAMTHELMLFAWLKPRMRNMSQKITGGRSVFDANVWKYNRVPAARADGGGREHNAQKPLDLVTRAIVNSSDEGALVLDFFLGSGTTLIAAQNVGRRCFGFEIVPAFADVTVLRWQRTTGASATLAGDGRTFDALAAERARRPKRRR